MIFRGEVIYYCNNTLLCINFNPYQLLINIHPDEKRRKVIIIPCTQQKRHLYLFCCTYIHRLTYTKNEVNLFYYYLHIKYYFFWGCIVCIICMYQTAKKQVTCTSDDQYIYNTGLNWQTARYNRGGFKLPSTAIVRSCPCPADYLSLGICTIKYNMERFFFFFLID